jgi:hypothetical protein
MSPRASQSRGDTCAAPGYLVLIQVTLARPGIPRLHHSRRRLRNGLARGVTWKETEMKITADGRGAEAEQGRRLSLIRLFADRVRDVQPVPAVPREAL